MALHALSSTTQTRWEIDPENTSIEFAIGNPFHRVLGRFTGVRGSAVTFGDSIDDAMIQVAIDAPSIDTGLKIRDRHLGYGLFLDFEHFPTISFASTSLQDRGDGRLRVFGDVSIRGVSRQVALDASVEQRDDDRARLVASTVLDRRDFKIGPKLMGITAGNKVRVRIALALNAR